MSDTSTIPSHLSTQASASLRVLYADDMDELRQLMQHTLAAGGFQITCMPDGMDAWNEIQQHPSDYDVLITDHHMAQMNGLELVQHLRQSGFGGRIIVISSELSEATDHAYHELHVDALLKKPIKFAQLPALLRNLTASHP